MKKIIITLLKIKIFVALLWMMFMPAHAVSSPIYPLMNIMNSNTWAVCSIVFCCILLASVLGLLLTPLRWLRRLCWTGFGLGTLLFIFPLIFAHEVSDHFARHNQSTYYSQPVESKGTSCSATAPSQVTVGEAFPYTITTNGSGKITEPDFKNFNTAGEKSTSSRSSVNVVNGKTCKSSTNEYTYYLSASKEGTFTIPAATFTVGKKVLKTNAVTVRVVQPASSHSQPAATTIKAASKSHTPKAERTQGNVFITAEVSNEHPYQGEEVILTHKLYVGQDVDNYEITSAQLPTEENISAYDIRRPVMLSEGTEDVHGKTYTVVTIRETAIKAGQSGKITIPPLSIKMMVGIPTYANDPFWGRVATDHYHEAALSSNAIVLDVKPLPTVQKPAHFDGPTGQYTISTNLSSNEVAKNETVQYNIIISGNGGVSSITAKQLNLQFPSHLEVSAPSVSDYYDSQNGQDNHTRVFTYLITPKKTHTYTLPSVKLNYFDPTTSTYKILSSNTLSLKVGRSLGQSNYLGSTGYLLLLLALIIIFLLCLIIFRKPIAAHRKAKQDGKRRQKAIRQLQNVKNFMDNQDSAHFYRALSQVLWCHVSEQYSIPLELLTMETARTYMSERGVDEERIATFIQLQSDCMSTHEEASATLEEFYGRALDFMSK